MPGFDQTGPAGFGPGTGRGMGPCGGGMAYQRGFRFAAGGGFGRGFGRGRGSCRNTYAEPEHLSAEGRKQLLEAELKRLEFEKAEIERRLKTIE